MFNRYQTALRSVYHKRTVGTDVANVKNCPHCDEGVSARAEQCWQCGETLNDPTDKPSVAAFASPGDGEPASQSDAGLSDEITQGAVPAASLSAEKARPESLPWSVRFGAAIFLIGLIGYIVSANKINADPFTYDIAQITSQFSWALFFGQHGVAIGVLGIGIAVFGFILSAHHKEK